MDENTGISKFGRLVLDRKAKTDAEVKAAREAQVRKNELNGNDVQSIRPVMSPGYLMPLKQRTVPPAW